ncbi:MAG: PEP-CTERM sorting domain-containing protein [Pirellulales bacterium]
MNCIFHTARMMHTLYASVAMLVLVLAARTGVAGDGAYQNPWISGDLIVNMSGEDVKAARADSAGFEPDAKSNSVTILTKSGRFSGYVTPIDSTEPSDLFVTAPDENDKAGTLYRIDRDTGTPTAVNSSINDGDGSERANGGLASDGDFLYLYDAAGNIDRYTFDGVKESDNLVTGITSGGFNGTKQIDVDNGFLFVATGGAEAQVAPVSGGVATTLAGVSGSEIVGIWAGWGSLFISDNVLGTVTAFDLDFSGPFPVASNPVIEGSETGSGGSLGGLAVDITGRKIYVGSAGSSGIGIPGDVLMFDVDGENQVHDGETQFFDVVAGLPNGGNVNPFLIPKVFIIGDMDINGRVDFDDISSFVLGLNDLELYVMTFGVPPVVNGDTDGNGVFDFDDIDGFVALLGNGDLTQAVPEPTSLLLILAAAGGLLTAAGRRKGGR